MAIIEVEQVSKVFPARRGARDLRGRGGVRDWILGRKTDTFEALKDIDLVVEPGESVGIIGRNGSGKSTLLSLLAGVSLPTTGTVTVRGRVASLLELGAGFHPILTGRENVYLNAGLLGMRHAQVDAVFDQIVSFSGIGEFIDQPVETYSSGMYVRIGFSVAVHVNPDVFLVDEVLSVGDEEFQRKCRRKIGELRDQQKTIVFVSHDLGIVNTLCERVVLLEHGRMIHRDTMQKTISFYLRQVGRERGVHTFREGETEAIACDGRVSVFHRQEEVTAPDGLCMRVESLGHHHWSNTAEWEVTERRPNGCDAQGQMSRLPVTLHWVLNVSGDTLRWDVSFECHRELPLTAINCQIALPTPYTNWICDDLGGEFPEIRATDTTWNMFLEPWDLEMGPDAPLFQIAAVPVSSAPLPPVAVRVRPKYPHFTVFVLNTEYVSNSRMFLIRSQIPDQERMFKPGRYEIASLEVDVSLKPEQIQQIMSSGRTIQSGRLQATFERGLLRLLYDGQELSSFIHIFTSMLIQRLWNVSMNLQWRPAHCDGTRLTAIGYSRRFPYEQEWELEATEEAIKVTIWLNVREAFDVEEYNLSVLLRSEYDHWEMESEGGAFAPFDPVSETWIHQNRTYTAGQWVRALSSSLPSVSLEVTMEPSPLVMTTLNTKLKENSRVLQAFRPSETYSTHFEAGRHLYFSGRIVVRPVQR